MVGVKGADHFLHELSQRLRRDDGHLRPPGHQVMRHLQKSAGAEAHRQRAVRLVGEVLRRMEQEGAGVGRGGGGEAQHDLLRLLLEHAERPLGIGLQVEVRRRRAGFVEDVEAMDRVEAEEHRLGAVLTRATR